MYILFPNGVRTDGIVTKIVPGAYALVGKVSKKLPHSIVAEFQKNMKQIGFYDTRVLWTK